jgi:hypothetical protein
MKAYGVVDVYIHIFLTSALAGSEWSASRPGHFTPGEGAPSTHWIESWVGPRAGLDDVQKRKFLTLPGLELRPPDRSACSQSLYRLCYPGSHTELISNINYISHYDSWILFRMFLDMVSLRLTKYKQKTRDEYAMQELQCDYTRKQICFCRKQTN